jgi:mannose-1-phosphate guanylyltransferase
MIPTQKCCPWAVILAGGDGVRLKPLTRLISGDDRPKQFCPLFGGRTLLAHTRARLMDVATEERTLFVVTRNHERFYKDELADVDDSRIVVQPANRGTAAALALTLIRIAGQDPDAVVAFIPSDHYYTNEKAFARAVQSAAAMAREHPRFLILLGVEPDNPEVEYGWIELGRPARLSTEKPLFSVCRFWEKPSAEVAQRLFEQRCLWNTFVMAGRAGTFLELLDFCAPRLLRAIATIEHGANADEVYSSLAPVDFSHQVLSQRTDRLLTLPLADAGWSDFGKPERVIATLARDGVQRHHAAALQVAWRIKAAASA